MMHRYVLILHAVQVTDALQHNIIYSLDVPTCGVDGKNYSSAYLKAEETTACYQKLPAYEPDDLRENDTNDSECGNKLGMKCCEKVFCLFRMDVSCRACLKH